MAKSHHLSLDRIKTAILMLTHEEARNAASEMLEFVIEARDNGAPYNLYEREGLQTLLWDWAENT